MGMKYLKLYEDYNEIDSIINLLTSGSEINFELGKSLYDNNTNYKSEKIENLFKLTEICKEFNINYSKLNKDLSVDVIGNVLLTSKKLSKLPIKFNKVTGNFNCSSNELTSFENFPKEVIGDLRCDMNNISSFDFCPHYISGEFSCYSNPIHKLYDRYVKNTKLNYNDFIKDFKNKKEYKLLFEVDEINTILGKITLENIDKLIEERTDQTLIKLKYFFENGLHIIAQSIGNFIFTNDEVDLLLNFFDKTGILNNEKLRNFMSSNKVKCKIYNYKITKII